MTKAEQAERDEAIAKLQMIYPKGSTVFTVLRHVSRSGMRRAISPVAVDGTHSWDYSYLVAKALGRRCDQTKGGVICDGAGMDMGFDLVYSLSATLYGHQNEGGYALRHRWL